MAVTPSGDNPGMAHRKACETSGPLPIDETDGGWARLLTGDIREDRIVVIEYGQFAILIGGDVIPAVDACMANRWLTSTPTRRRASILSFAVFGKRAGFSAPLRSAPQRGQVIMFSFFFFVISFFLMINCFQCLSTVEATPGPCPGCFARTICPWFQRST